MLAQRLGKRDPVAVRQLAQLVLVGHRARGRRGAEERAAEARPSSSAQLTSRTVTGGVALLRDPAQHLDRGEDVEAAVEPAAVRHGVDVTAEQDGALGRAAQRPPLVAGLVDVVLERQALELRAEPLLRRSPRSPSTRPAARRSRRRSARAARAARRRFCGIEGHGVNLTTRRRVVSTTRGGCDGSGAAPRGEPRAVRAATQAGLFVAVLAVLWALWEGVQVVRRDDRASGSARSRSTTGRCRTCTTSSARSSSPRGATARS